MNREHLIELTRRYTNGWVGSNLDKLASNDSVEDVIFQIEKEGRLTTASSPEELRESANRFEIASIPSRMSLICNHCEEFVDSPDMCCKGNCPVFEDAVEYAEDNPDFDPCKYCDMQDLNCTGILNGGGHIDFSNYNINELDNSTDVIERLIESTGIEDEIPKSIYYYIKNRYETYRKDTVDYNVLRELADIILRTGNINMTLKENDAGKLLKGAYLGEKVRCLITKSHVVFGDKPSKELLEFIGKNFDLEGKSIAY